MEIKNQPKLICNFCQKTTEEIEFLIAGAEAYICDECIALCVEIIMEQKLDSQKAILKAVKG